jgi:hypothetical protein
LRAARFRTQPPASGQNAEQSVFDVLDRLAVRRIDDVRADVEPRRDARVTVRQDLTSRADTDTVDVAIDRFGRFDVRIKNAAAAVRLSWRS